MNTVTPPAVPVEAIRSWSATHKVDPWALTVDDLTWPVSTEQREQIEAMPADDRALLLWISFAAATMTPAEREAVGFQLVDRGEPTAEDLQASDVAAVRAIRARFPGAPEDEADWDRYPIASASRSRRASRNRWWRLGRRIADVKGEDRG